MPPPVSTGGLIRIIPQRSIGRNPGIMGIAKQMNSSPNLSLLGPFLAVYRHWHVLLPMLRRDIAARYRGSVLDIAWVFLQPALFVAVFYFVFTVVFASRWAVGDGAATANFGLLAYAGLIVFNLFSEAVIRGPSLLLDNSAYVKKLLFPIEVLAPIAVGSGLYSAMLNSALLLVLVLVLGDARWQMLLFPLALLPIMLLTLGCTWFLSALGVYFRDSRQIVALAMTGLMFLSPIFYPIAAVPPPYQGLLLLNPLASAIEMARAALFGGAIDWASWVISLIFSFVALWLGYAWFQLTRRGFSDVL